MEDRWAGLGMHDRASAALGAVLVGLGVLFLVTEIPGVRLGNSLWPFFVIIPGLAFFVAMVLGGRQTGALAIPGCIVTTVGLLLLYMNGSGHWESWSYAWALIPTAVGLGLMIHGSWSDLPAVRQAGKRLTTVGAVLFLVFGAFFELVLDISGSWHFSRWFWPMLLIALGGYMLVRRRVTTDL